MKKKIYCTPQFEPFMLAEDENLVLCTSEISGSAGEFEENEWGIEN